MPRSRADARATDRVARSRGRPGRRDARLLAGVVAIVLLGPGLPSCATGAGADDEDEPPPVGVVETLDTLSLAAPPGGIATTVAITLGIEPLGLGDFTVVGRGPRDGVADDAQLQLSLQWRDFVGTSPTSFGGRRSWPTAFGDDGRAARGAPLQRTFAAELDAPQPHVLARRITVSARFHPIDLVSELVRSGGARMEFPEAVLETLAREPEGTLAEWFELDGDRDPEELFLRAAAAPVAQREQVVTRLISTLAALKGAEREAGFGALHFLTGETQGRSVYAWETWLRERARTDAGAADR